MNIIPIILKKLFGKKDIFHFTVGDFDCRVVIRGQAPTTLDQLQKDIIKDALKDAFTQMANMPR